MRGITVFDRNADEYDHWFDANADAYESEVAALRRFVPRCGKGVEIGVGTGRFAVPLGVRFAVELADGMARIAARRGVLVLRGRGESLPFGEDSFDFALLVTVLCFVESVSVVLREVRQVLREKGRIVVGFIDRESPLGRLYESHKAESRFYREARFFSVSEMSDVVSECGFEGMEYCQTVFGVPKPTERQPVRPGYGEGAFVVLSAVKR